MNLKAFAQACRKNDPQMLTQVVVDIASVDLGVSRIRHAIIRLLEKGHVEVLRELIALGFDVNQPLSVYGESALDVAVVNDQPEVVLTLCEAGADPNRKGESTVTPVYRAGGCSTPEILEILETFGGTLPSMGIFVNRSPVIPAAEANSVANLEFLHSRGVPIDIADMSGCTPLISAAAYGSIDALKWLIAHGADRNATFDNGRTLVDVARDNDQQEIVALLAGE